MLRCLFPHRELLQHFIYSLIRMIYPPSFFRHVTRNWWSIRAGLRDIIVLQTDLILLLLLSILAIFFVIYLLYLFLGLDFNHLSLYPLYIWITKKGFLNEFTLSLLLLLLLLDFFRMKEFFGFVYLLLWQVEFLLFFVLIVIVAVLIAAIIGF